MKRITNKNHLNKQKGITLIALVITIIVLLILAGVTIAELTGNGLLVKAQQAEKQTKYIQAKESLQLMLLEIKTRIITEEKRDTQLTDCEELKGRDEIGEIDYKGEETFKYAQVIYKNYMFKVDEKLNIIEDSNYEDNEEPEDGTIAGSEKYLYNRGKISEEAKGFVGVHDINSEYEIREKELYMTTKKGEGCNFTYIGTENKINLTNYSKIKCLVSTGNVAEGFSGNEFALVISDKQKPDVIGVVYQKSKIIGPNETNYILEFEIPDECFDKEFYIGVMGTLQDIHVYEIWLERSETKMLYEYGKFSKEVDGFVGANDKNSEYAIHENNLYMTTKKGNGFNFTYVGTENKINLTGYRKIRCLVSTGNNTDGYSGNIFALALNDKQLPNNLDSNGLFKISNTIGANKTNYTLGFEIPEDCMNQQFYIGVTGTLQDIYVYKIWLEK